jgi:hypothetical protein
MQIRKIKRKELDCIAWNNCLEQSENCRIYASTWYLDAVTDGFWDALIYGDYQAIMPLPFTSKAGIKFYLQPTFCQQLGPFWKKSFPTNLLSDFLKTIPHSLYQINLSSEFGFFLTNINANYKKNYVLKLNSSYGDMLKIMSSNHKRNIHKSEKHNIKIQDFTIDKYVEFKKKSGTKLKDKEWRRLTNLLYAAAENDCLNIRAAFEDDIVVSVVCWIKDFKRIIYLQAASNEAGKKSAAAFALVNEILKDKQNSQNLIDFEGSEIVNVGRFYKGFGAKNESYPTVIGKQMKIIKSITGK